MNNKQLYELIELLKNNYEEGIEKYKQINHSLIRESWFYEKVLFLSCEMNRKELVEMIILQSSHRMHKQDFKGRNILIKSILHDSYDCIEYIMNLKEFKTTLSDKEGNTYVHYLVQREYCPFYSTLLSTAIVLSSELLNKKNSDGETPLHLACLKGNIQFVKQLIENGASLYALTRDKQSIVEYAYHSEKNTEELVAFVELQMSLFPNTSMGSMAMKKISIGGKRSSENSDSSPGESPRSSKESSPIPPTVVELESPPSAQQAPRKNSLSLLSGFFQKKQPEVPKEEIYRQLLTRIQTEIITTIIPPRTEDPMKKKFRMISVDGGGIKCILQIIIFSRLVEKFPTLFDDVDLYCGVSASSFICCQLASGMKPTDVQQLMIEMCKHIFEKKSRGLTESLYSNKYLTTIADITFGNMKLSDLPKRVLINAFQFDTGATNPNRTCKACVFNNFIPGHDCKIADAIIRSTAAVGYFPPYQGYADGGIFENNPCTLAFPHVFGDHGLHIPVKNAVCLSISSGRPPITYIDSEKYTDVGIFQLLPLTMNGMFWSRKSMADEVARGFLGERYMRFDPVLPESIDLDNAQHIPAICDLASKIDISQIEEWILTHWF